MLLITIASVRSWTKIKFWVILKFIKVLKFQCATVICKSIPTVGAYITMIMVWICISSMQLTCFTLQVFCCYEGSKCFHICRQLRGTKNRHNCGFRETTRDAAEFATNHALSVAQCIQHTHSNDSCILVLVGFRTQ